jgi:hypothetical protein
MSHSYFAVAEQILRAPMDLREDPEGGLYLEPGFRAGRAREIPGQGRTGWLVTRLPQAGDEDRLHRCGRPRPAGLERATRLTSSRGRPTGETCHMSKTTEPALIRKPPPWQCCTRPWGGGLHNLASRQSPSRASARLIDLVMVLRDRGLLHARGTGGRTALGYPGRTGRFEVHYVLRNLATAERLVVKVGDAPTSPSHGLRPWPGADRMGRGLRHVWDSFRGP